MIRFTIFLSIVLSSSLAWAEEAGEAEEPTDRVYNERIQEGHRLYTNRVYQEALGAYQAALAERPNDPMAIYLIGCAQRALEQWDEALASFQRAARLAGADDPALHARALMNVALVHEAQNRLTEAAEAWQVYIAYAESHQDVPTYVPNARERLEVIQAYQDLDTAYTVVRRRIRERQESEANE